MIPCVAAIVTALALARGQITPSGAVHCVGFIELKALLAKLKPFDIHWTVTRS